MGSRYGGLKQIDPVGPSGETVLDYAVFDATRAGFGRVVFVIRPEFEETFRSSVTSKYAGAIAVDYVHQSSADLPNGFAAPAGRQKPWGTGHAVWCARHAVGGPFAVINADDFYGAAAYARIGAFLGGARGAEFAIVGFRLANTLSENGTVSRGVCRARFQSSTLRHPARLDRRLLSRDQWSAAAELPRQEKQNAVRKVDSGGRQGDGQSRRGLTHAGSQRRRR